MRRRKAMSAALTDRRVHKRLHCGHFFAGKKI
jgi:hypothetical protein